jgi:hypothetical protein
MLMVDLLLPGAGSAPMALLVSQIAFTQGDYWSVQYAEMG